MVTDTSILSTPIRSMRDNVCSPAARESAHFRSARMNSEMEALQSKLTWAEDLLETLNTTVWRQQQRIDRLEEDVRTLRQLIQESAMQSETTLRDDIPPHW